MEAERERLGEAHRVGQDQATIKAAHVVDAARMSERTRSYAVAAKISWCNLVSCAMGF